MSGMNILIVEDDPDLCEAYKIILTSSGYEVMTATNGEEALHAVSTHSSPDIIFLDLRMPVLDGIGFLRKYKPFEHPDTTIVVFSNYDAQKEVDEAFALGADRYVLKAKASPGALVKIVQGIQAENESPKSANP